jgi:hypothetical protein
MYRRMSTPSMHAERCESGHSSEPGVEGSELARVPTARRDSGTTLIEILVSIVLIGTAVVSTLGALRISVIGGTIHRDHANAHAWLQSASDVLYASEKEDCDTSLSDGGKAMIIGTYQPVVDAVANPEGWTNTQIRVVDLEFWNATDTDGDGIVEYRFGSVCQDSINLSLQRITIEVRSPDGRIIEEVELVK